MSDDVEYELYKCLCRHCPNQKQCHEECEHCGEYEERIGELKNGIKV